MKRTLSAILASIASIACADWTPPANPDPDQIFMEAKSDAAAGRYSEALEKHVWFHQNALKHKPGLYGVRLSFALNSWAELGSVYPPALQKLKSVRDETAKNVPEGKGSREAFHDVQSINKILGEDSKTKDLFIWLHSNNPNVAKKVFDLAQPALLKAKEYRLCGAYIDADTSFQQLLSLYRENKRMAQDPNFGKRIEEFGKKSFSHGTATLVALLVLNERKADADRIVAEAMKEWDDAEFRKQLEKARKGNVPPPWP